MRILFVLALSSALLGCGGDSRTTASVDGGDRGDPGEPGDPGDPELPDESCDGADRVCVGLEVRECDDDGPGDVLEACETGCSAGSCTSTCGTAGVDKIYVVGDDYRLLRFDPAALPGAGSADAAFSLVGQLQCPAGDALGGLGLPATPFSMSVDREGRAWVLYSSGEIFHVSIDDASCSPTSFVPQQDGFELFGMGFAADEPGATTETLFIAGGAATQDQGFALGSIDGSTLDVTRIASITPTPPVGPELTGTGAAELWGYFPGFGLAPSRIARMDRSTAATDQTISLPELSGSPRAWAFAQYGGKFYVFVTATDPFGLSDVPEVQVADPATGQVVAYSTSHIIVGAGVSTCAPSAPVE